MNNLRNISLIEKKSHQKLEIEKRTLPDSYNGLAVSLVSYGESTG